MGKRTGRVLAVLLLAALTLGLCPAWAMATTLDQETEEVASPIDQGDEGSGELVEASSSVIAEGECGTCNWTVTDAGVLRISPIDGRSGTLVSSGGQIGSFFPWYEYGEQIISAVFEPGVRATGRVCFLFDDCPNMEECDVSGLDTSDVVDFSYMFENCRSLRSLDVSSFDLSGATRCDGMFYNCASLESLDLSKWDMSSVENVASMFAGCKSLSHLDVSNWDVSSVKMYCGDGLTWLARSFPTGMFEGCSSLESLDLSGWVTPAVTDLSKMFSGCESLKELVLSDWDTASVADMSSMFSGCSSLVSLDLSGWETSSVAKMGSMFSGCESLKELVLSDWDTASVADMSSMFSGCSSLVSLDLSGWETSSVAKMGSMFSGCSRLASILVGTRWSTTAVTESGMGMFEGCNSLKGGYGTVYDSSHTNAERACVDAPNMSGYLTLAAYGICGTCRWEVNDDGVLIIHEGTLASNDYNYNNFWPWYGLDVYGLKVVSVVLDGVVSGSNSMADAFSGMKDLESANLSSLDTSSVLDMSGMFEGCSSLESLDLSGWVTPAVTDLSNMFSGCESLNELIITNWDTSSVARMDGLFSGCSSLESLDLSDWDTSSVRYMDSVFEGCASLKSLDVSDWDTSHVGETINYEGKDGHNMAHMFQGCSSLRSLDVSRWDVHQVKSMNSMFAGCSSLADVDVSAWDLSGSDKGYGLKKDMASMFKDCSSLSSLDMTKWETAIDYLTMPRFGRHVQIESAGIFDGCTPRSFAVGDNWLEKLGDEFPLPISSSSSGEWWSSLDHAWYTNDEILTDRSTIADTYYVEAQVQSRPNIADAVVTPISDQIYSGSEIVPVISVVFGDVPLEEGKDYTLSCSDNLNVGTATVTIEGVGNYEGSKAVAFEIVAKSISGVTIDPVAKQVHTGSAIEPSPVVRDGSLTLNKGEDYDLHYEGNIAVGTATIVVAGKGNYTGSKTTTFEIVAPAKTFPDVKAGAWYGQVVGRAAGLGLVTGYADGTFGPDDSITRGQVAVILWRMAGQPKAGAAGALSAMASARSFPDVKSGAYYYQAVSWASSAGVVSGYASGKFGPNDKVTREQLAVMLANYARKVGGLEVKGSKGDFSSMKDASKVAGYATSAVGWCFRNKILSGSQGNVLPKGNATRAQAAKMLVFLYDMVS